MRGTTVAFGILLTLGVVTWFACCGWVVYDWRRRQDHRGTGEAQLIRVDHGCAGCLGQGSHRRWCATVVGPSASYLGLLSQDAEMLAEQIGTEEPDAAKACYLAALFLRDRAIVLSHEYESQTVASDEAEPTSGVEPRQQLTIR